MANIILGNNQGNFNLISTNPKMDASNPNSSSDKQNKTEGAVEAEESAAPGTGDQVAISEEAKSLAVNAGGMASPESSEGEGEDPKDALLRQIQEVQRKLEAARERLAQAENTSGSGNSAPAESSQTVSSGAAEGGEAAAMGGNPAAETIRVEIEMLTQQLMVLNQQLQSMSQGGGGGAGGGTSAGIGGPSSGPSGQGQRISVYA